MEVTNRPDIHTESKRRRRSASSRCCLLRLINWKMRITNTLAQHRLIRENDSRYRVDGVSYVVDTQLGTIQDRRVPATIT